MNKIIPTLMVWMALAIQAEANAPVSVSATHLQALIRAGGINPPGNEKRAIDLIADWLRAEGITPTIYGASPDRPSLVARLNAGTAPDPAHALMLLGHVDVVPVEAQHWSHDPFAAEIDDGKLWGRGALDMKDLVVMELEAFIHLKRSNVKLARDVIFCAVPDEEAGGKQGAQWLLKHHQQEVMCAELLNEGGYGLFSEDASPMMGIQTAERGVLWTRITATGTPGHGSQDRPDSAPRRLLRALARLEATPRRYELGPETGPMLAAISASQTGAKQWVLRALSNPWFMPLVAPLVVSKEPMLGSLLSDTVNPDVILCGQKVNVVPSEATVEIDMRLLPGHSVSDSLTWLKKTLDDPSLKVEILQAQEASRNAADGRLFKAIAAAAGSVYPGIHVAPIMTPGGATDSAWFRPLGVKCYGCAPILATTQQLASIHGDNEFISVEQLEKGAEVIKQAILQAATEP